MWLLNLITNVSVLTSTVFDSVLGSSTMLETSSLVFLSILVLQIHHNKLTVIKHIRLLFIDPYWRVQ